MKAELLLVTIESDGSVAANGSMENRVSQPADERRTVEIDRMQPWEWPEAHWRRLVDQVRAGRALRPAKWKNSARCAVAFSFGRATIPPDNAGNWRAALRATRRNRSGGPVLAFDRNRL
jgi:hypothetical protein